VTDTKQRILDATLDELDAVGPSQLRLKRVAAAANVSLSLISVHFGNREDLISTAMLQRFERLFDLFMGPYPPDADQWSPSDDELIEMARNATDRAQNEDRRSMRLRLLEAGAIAAHNPISFIGLLEINERANEKVLAFARKFEQQGLLAPGVDAIGFSRIWFCMLFGQVTVEYSASLAMDDQSWTELLRISLVSLFAPEVRSAYLAG